MTIRRFVLPLSLLAAIACGGAGGASPVAPSLGRGGVCGLRDGNRIGCHRTWTIEDCRRHGGYTEGCVVVEELHCWAARERPQDDAPMTYCMTLATDCRAAEARAKADGVLVTPCD
jgi:hypothetical protein